MRRLTIAFEGPLQQKIPAKMQVMSWLAKSAAFVLTHFQVGRNGLMPWRRPTGRPWKGTVADFRGKLSAAQALGLQENLLSVASDYFQVDLSVEFGRVRQRYLALYQRQGQNWPLLLWLQQR